MPDFVFQHGDLPGKCSQSGVKDSRRAPDPIYVLVFGADGIIDLLAMVYDKGVAA
jgi:hypothetical protein